jgi:hypothetical protein
VAERPTPDDTALDNLPLVQHLLDEFLSLMRIRLVLQYGAPAGTTTVKTRTVAVYPRVPLVPGVSATGENLRMIARLLREIGAGGASLLPHNPLGLEMWNRLGKTQPPLSPGFVPARDEELVCETFRTLLQATETHAGSCMG